MYERTVETFGTDQVTVVCLRDPDLFDPERLALIEELAYQLESLPGVVRVESLFSVADFRNDAGTLRSGPLMRQPPADREEALAARARALENTLVAGNLLSRDGTTTSVNVFVEPDRTTRSSTTPWPPPSKSSSNPARAVSRRPSSSATRTSARSSPRP
jgi:predicted RND superfamily exporter protein